MRLSIKAADGPQAGAAATAASSSWADAALTAAATTPSEDLLEEGRAAANRGNWPAAQAAVDRALAEQPMDAAAHYLHGQVLEHSGEHEAALSAYRRSVYLDPAWVLGTLGMAGIWRQMGSPDEAQRGYRRALSQLGRLAPEAPVPGADGATAAELSGYARAQLDLLG